jgi:hypothetical protein
MRRSHLVTQCLACRWLKIQFQEADVDKNGSLNYEECLTLLKHLNVKLPRPTVKRMFDVSAGLQVKWCDQLLQIEKARQRLHSLRGQR